jgi:hypothetical protein
MSKTLTAALASVMLVAGSSLAFAADTGRDSHNDAFGADRGPSIEERQELDYGTTGSITNCETQMWDTEGNCVVDPAYQMQ